MFHKLTQVSRLLLLPYLFSFLPPAALAEVYVFTGVYQGKDLYVKNPFSPDGVGFCVLKSV